MKFPNQSHVVNLLIELIYDDLTEYHELKNPTDIGDCWGTWHGRYHDTAADCFENLGVRFGPAGSAVVEDMTNPIHVDTDAHILKYKMLDGKILRKSKIESVANDAIFGIIGAAGRI